MHGLGHFLLNYINMIENLRLFRQCGHVAWRQLRRQREIDELIDERRIPDGYQNMCGGAICHGGGGLIRAFDDKTTTFGNR